MMTRTITAALAIMLAAGCFPDVEEGKTKATVSTPKVEAPAEAAAAEPVTTKTVAIDTTRSKIAAVGAKITAKHDIAFDKWSGTLTLAGDKLTGVDVTIEMASLRADQQKLTGHLKSPDFFDVAKFPQATFKASRVEAKPQPGGATHLVVGNLTMHGVTKEVSFAASVKVGNGVATATAEFVINRQDFGIKYPGMPDDLIKDEVALTIDLTADAPNA